MTQEKENGFTLLELVISCGLIGMSSLWVAGLLKKPNAVLRMMTASDNEKLAANAVNIFVNDLTEADPASIPWTSLPTSPGLPSAISFWKLKYDLSNPGSPAQNTYAYSVQSDGAGRGSLIRSVDGHSTVVLSHIDLPTAASPLVQADPDAFHILEISLSYHPDTLAPVLITRRVAIKG